MKLKGWSPSPAMLVALGALVLSVGGNVTAAVLITSADIKDNTIRSVDIRDETVKSRDVDNGTLIGADVKDNSLTGADINESTLGKVPNADKLDGLDSTQLLRRAESFTRQFSCAGPAWENGSSTDGYMTAASVLKYGNGSFTVFYCNVDIPTGATVTGVSFVVHDTAPANVVSCFLLRTNMTTAIGTQIQMAQVVSSFTPGNVRLTDTTITQPLINNTNFSYSLACVVGNTDTTGIYGGMVTYRVNAATG